MKGGSEAYLASGISYLGGERGRIGNHGFRRFRGGIVD
jgi:hypothetical protein